MVLTTAAACSPVAEPAPQLNQFADVYPEKLSGYACHQFPDPSSARDSFVSSLIASLVALPTKVLFERCFNNAQQEALPELWLRLMNPYKLVFKAASWRWRTGGKDSPGRLRRLAGALLSIFSIARLVVSCPLILFAPWIDASYTLSYPPSRPSARSRVPP